MKFEGQKYGKKTVFLQIIIQINKSKTARAVVEAIIFFASKVGIKTVAEFVSTKEIYETCKEINIDYFQGYWFDEPKNVKDLKNGGLIKCDLILEY